MRVAIAGAGALGSVLGGLLAQAGTDVCLLAHGAHDAALRRGPLELRLPDQTLRVDVERASTANADVVVLTAKRFDSDAALDRIAGVPALALSLQNGVEKNRELVVRFGPQTVASAATTIGAALVRPGVVEVSGLGAVYLENRSRAAADFARSLRDAGLDTRLVDNGSGTDVEWSKLAHVASVMAVQSIARRPLHELFGRRESALLIRTLIAEIGAVAVGYGSKLDDLETLLPVATLATVTDDEAATILERRAAALVERGATNLRTSMLHSIEEGRRTELDGIHGALIRWAHARGVEVPALRTCYRLLRLSGA